jgi:hypothetical protein
MYPSGRWYGAVVAQVHRGTAVELTLDWNDGDNQHRRQPLSYVRRPTEAPGRGPVSTPTATRRAPLSSNAYTLNRSPGVRVSRMMGSSTSMRSPQQLPQQPPQLDRGGRSPGPADAADLSPDGQEMSVLHEPLSNMSRLRRFRRDHDQLQLSEAVGRSSSEADEGANGGRMARTMPSLPVQHGSRGRGGRAASLSTRGRGGGRGGRGGTRGRADPLPPGVQLRRQGSDEFEGAF